MLIGYRTVGVYLRLSESAWLIKKVSEIVLGNWTHGYFKFGEIYSATSLPELMLLIVSHLRINTGPRPAILIANDVINMTSVFLTFCGDICRRRLCRVKEVQFRPK